MAILPVCSKCGRENGYAKQADHKICARCLNKQKGGKEEKPNEDKQ